MVLRIASGRTSEQRALQRSRRQEGTHPDDTTSGVSLGWLTDATPALGIHLRQYLVFITVFGRLAVVLQNRR
jgi:hypothetical protein